jgi:hypothetical protein
VKRKKWSGFSKYFQNGHLVFYVMKVVGKIHLDVFVIGRIANFHFHPILEFSN